MTEAVGAKMATTDAVAHYLIDTRTSRFTVRVFASGLLSSFGHNPTIGVREYSGEATFVPGSLGQAFVKISVQSDSLEVMNDISQKDRLEIESKMRQEVLETSSYPQMVFESTQCSANKMGENSYTLNVSGNFTLHGVTRSETVYAQAALMGDALRAYGEFSLRQTDYGITPVSVAGGSLKVKDEVKVSFDLEFLKPSA